MLYDDDTYPDDDVYRSLAASHGLGSRDFGVVYGLTSLILTLAKVTVDRPNDGCSFAFVWLESFDAFAI